MYKKIGFSIDICLKNLLVDHISNFTKKINNKYFLNLLFMK